MWRVSQRRPINFKKMQLNQTDQAARLRHQTELEIRSTKFGSTSMWEVLVQAATGYKFLKQQD